MDGEFVPWTRKYSPKSASDLEGLEKPYSEMKKFVSNFKRGKGLMLYGSSGSGKTSSAYALAHELKLELIEINASDSRNAGSIDSIIGNASRQMSLFSTGKIILVDEVEGISGREDRGGVQALVKIIEASSFPIIITCQDPYDEKLKPLRKACALVEFGIRQHTGIAGYLKKICAREKVVFDEEALSMIARKANGDLRAAINDLQSCARDGKITRQEVAELGERERTEKVESALLRVFKTSDPKVALGAFDNVDEDLEEIFFWVDENLPREYLKPEDLARGFEQLSRADVFKGRILRWQHYRFYVYCYQLLSVGIALSKEERYRQAVEYRQTTRKLKIWMANMKNMKKKAIAEKIAAKTHMGKRQAFRDTLPYLRNIFRHDRKQGARIAEFLDLDSEQAEYLSG
jgi:replication factor C large subunit